jgi:hypothetical protein
MSSWFRPVRLAIVHNHTMGSLFLSLVRALRSAFHTHADLVVENLALRQQLANFQRTSTLSLAKTLSATCVFRRWGR